MSDKLIGEVFGCLEILDEGMDYEQFVDDKIKCIEDEKKEFIDAINNKKKIMIEYFSKGVKKSRCILPIQIYVYENTIMVVVRYSDEPNDIRHLNLKRIENIIM